MVTATIPASLPSPSLGLLDRTEQAEQADQTEQQGLPSSDLISTRPVPGFNRLPTEIEIVIIRLLGPRELLKASETCKHWYRIITDAEWFRVCKQMLPRWSLGLEFDELRGDRPWKRYTMETYLRTKTQWRAPIQPSNALASSLNDPKSMLSTSSSRSATSDHTPSTAQTDEPPRVFLNVPRDQFLIISNRLQAPNLAWQNIGPPIPHTHLASGETLVAFMQARYHDEQITHQIALYSKGDMSSPLATISNSTWCEPGPFNNRPWFWPFQAQQLQVAQVMDFTHYPDQRDMYGRVKMVFVIALGENSGPLGGAEGEMHVLDVWLTLKVIELFVPMTTPAANQPSHLSFSHFPSFTSASYSRLSSRASETSTDNEIFRTAIETIVPYHHQNEAIRGRMATTFIRKNEKSGEDEDWIAIFGIRHAAEGQAVFLSIPLFSEQPIRSYRKNRHSIIQYAKHQPHESPYPISRHFSPIVTITKSDSMSATSQLRSAQAMSPIPQTQSLPSSTMLSTTSSRSVSPGEHSAVQLSPPPGSQALSNPSPQLPQQLLTAPTAPPPRKPFTEIAAGASCMSLFPANSDFEHLMVVVTAEGEGFIFDWVRNRHVARLSTATTFEEDSIIEKIKEHKVDSAASSAHVAHAAYAANSTLTTVLAEPGTSTTGITTAKAKNLYHWGVQVNWAIEEPDVTDAQGFRIPGPRTRGNFRIVTMADGTNKEWMSSYWHVDEKILRWTTPANLGKRAKNPVEDHPPGSRGLEYDFLNLGVGGSEEAEESTTDDEYEIYDRQPASKRRDRKKARSIGSLIGTCDAPVAIQMRRGESAKDVLAPGQSLIESATTLSQSDRDAAKTLPALLTKNRHFVLQTTGLSQESFQTVTVGVERDSVHPYLLENASIFKENKDDISTSKDNLPNNVGDNGSSSSSSGDLDPSSFPSSSPSSFPSSSCPAPLPRIALRPEASAADKSLLFIAYLIWDHYRIALTSQYGLCLIDMDKEHMGDVEGAHQEWVTILPNSRDDPLVDIATIDDCLFITRKFSHEIWPFRSALRKAGSF